MDNYPVDSCAIYKPYGFLVKHLCCCIRMKAANNYHLCNYILMICCCYRKRAQINDHFQGQVQYMKNKIIKISLLRPYRYKRSQLICILVSLHIANFLSSSCHVLPKLWRDDTTVHIYLNFYFPHFRDYT